MRLTILLVTFFVSTLSFGQMKLNDLKVDTTITGFHFAGDFNGTFVYTPNGRSDIKANKGFSYFSFTILRNTTMKAATDQLETLANNSIQDGFYLSELVKTDTTINGNKAVLILFVRTKGNSKTMVFNAVIMKRKTAIIFACSDIDKGKHYEKFKNTFYTMEL